MIALKTLTASAKWIINLEDFHNACILNTHARINHGYFLNTG